MWGVIDTEVYEEKLSSVRVYDNEIYEIVCLAKVSGINIKESSPSNFQGHVNLKCPQLLMVDRNKEPKNCDPENPQGFTIIIKGKAQQFEAEFVPDIELLYPLSKLLCAEMVRVAVQDPRISEDWLVTSHRIVLRRIDNIVPLEEPVYFERVGRF